MQDAFTNHIVERLYSESDKFKSDWVKSNKHGYHYLIIDNILPREWCYGIYDSFPGDLKMMRHLNTFRERKRTLAVFDSLNTNIRDITYAFQDSSIIQAIENITGMYNLEPDPHLYASGISIMQKGDFLNPHLDNSHNVNKKKIRQINLLYYVSPNWTHEFGGNLELWDSDVSIATEIISKFNRLIIMETNQYSWHSVNQVSIDSKRCCVSNYLFSPIRENYKTNYRVTTFMGRPEQPMLRMLSQVDNSMRQLFANTTGISRGKKYMPK